MENESKEMSESGPSTENSIKSEGSNKKEASSHLILNQVPKNIKGTQPLPYHFGSETYDVYRNLKNPFTNRLLSGEISPLDISPEKVQSLFQQYEKTSPYSLEFPSNISAHRRRKVTSAIPHPAPSSESEKTNSANKSKTSSDYLTLDKLKEDKNKLNGAIKAFFQHVLQRLREDPNCLPIIVNELVPLLVLNKMKIRIYDAYRKMRSLDELFYTLEAITEDYELENFELFCSALFGFYSQK